MAKRVTTVVGLEIEPSAIHAAAVTVNGGITIREAAVVPLEAGVVRDGEVNDVEGLADALKTLYAEHRGLDKRVRIGVANQKIVVRVIELPAVIEAKELEAAVRFQAQDEIPMPLDSAVLDYMALGVSETPAGPRQRVLIVAARRDMIDKVLAAARSAGLRPEGIDLSAFAMVRSLHAVVAGEEGPVLYLSVGGLTNLAVAEGTNCLFTRVVGGGLEAIAIELAERRALSLEHSRGWLAHVGLDAVVETLDGDEETVAEARTVLIDGVRRIGSEVRNSLDFHRAQEGHATPVSRAVLTGAAASIPGFSEALGNELGLPIDVADIAGAPPGIDAGLLAVAAGLAIEEAPQP